MTAAEDRKKFDLGDYVEVKDRIAILYELYPKGALVTDEVQILTAPDGKQRVMVKALAYRSPDDPHPGVGYSWLELPGTTPYTKGSEIENAETSAWGRAIGSLGILIDRSIATHNEIDSKQEGAPRPEPVPDEPFEATVEGKVTYSNKAPVDGEFRQTPDGLMWGFALEAEGGKRLQVIAVAPLAAAIQFALGATGPAELKGQWVTAHGLIERIPWDKGGKKMPPYQRMTLARIETPAFVLPAPLEAVSEPLGLEEA